MGVGNSFLTDKMYGYDCVVATTQRSINATMKDFVKRLSSPMMTTATYHLPGPAKLWHIQTQRSAQFYQTPKGHRSVIDNR
jgi:hypothetical protein